jgi:hypothetical protein
MKIKKIVKNNKKTKNKKKQKKRYNTDSEPMSCESTSNVYFPCSVIKKAPDTISNKEKKN